MVAPTGVETAPEATAPVSAVSSQPVAQSAPASPASVSVQPTQQPTTKPTNATTLATEAPAAETRLEGASIDLEQQTGRIEDSPEELIRKFRFCFGILAILNLYLLILIFVEFRSDK